MAAKITPGSVVEFLDAVGLVLAVNAGRVRAYTQEGDYFEAPARLCAVQYAALPEPDEAAASPWYCAPVDEPARAAVGRIWA
jgi:hypothetical protein